MNIQAGQQMLVERFSRPAKLHTTGTLAWGYNASISSWKGSTPSSESGFQHARTRISQLEVDTDVGLLCLFGKQILIAKTTSVLAEYEQALAYAESRPRLAQVHSIYTCTFASLFFGTPRHGSSEAIYLAISKGLRRSPFQKLQ